MNGFIAEQINQQKTEKFICANSISTYQYAKGIYAERTFTEMKGFDSQLMND